jgi:hypothetical protein
MEFMRTTTSSTNASGSFLSQLGDKVSAVLHGFDRLRLRGTLRELYCPTVMEAYLCAQHLRYRDYGALVEKLTAKVKASAEALAAKLSRPVIYLASSARSKEQEAREIAAREGIEEGLIAIFKAVEPCQAYAIRRQREASGFEFRMEVRKCLHFYFYFAHAVFGFMHVRLQSWFPFRVDVCLNGRHWLARQLTAAGIAYGKRENALLWVEDPVAAQRFLDAQVDWDWRRALDGLLTQTHPQSALIRRPLHLQYYWSVAESEFATDCLFRDPADLARLYPSLVHHGLRSFSSPDVMRFLGRKVPTTGGVDPRFTGEVISDLKQRPEGVRIKHSVGGNSIKLYDKQGSVLRVETTINNPVDFRVYRRAENQPQGEKDWRVLRRSVCDLPRRAAVSRAANERYLGALAAVHSTIPLLTWTKQVCQSHRHGQRRWRALNPLSPNDAALLRAVNRGEWAINGFRNRDLRHRLYPGKTSVQKEKQNARKTGRRIFLLRQHGLISKVSHTHRYVLTEKGRLTITALLAAADANTEQLTKLAA